MTILALALAACAADSEIERERMSIEVGGMDDVGPCLVSPELLPLGAPPECVFWGDTDCDGVLRIECGGTDLEGSHVPQCLCGDPLCDGAFQRGTCTPIYEGP